MAGHRSWRGLAHGIVITAIILFILVPLAMVVWTAVQSAGVPTFPPKDLTLSWFGKAVEGRWMGPLRVSMELAVATSVVATILGTAAAYGLTFNRGRWRHLLDAYLASPLLAPEIIISLALLQVLSQLSLRGLLGGPALLGGHVLLGIPYVVRTVGVSLSGVRESWTRAAADLGASRWETFRRIVLPLIMPGIFAGALFSFIVSFNNVELSLFLITSDQVTLPMAILQFLEYDYSPVIAAVGIVSLIPIIVLAAVAGRFMRISEFIYAQKGSKS